jgi:hypothetical protein
MIRIIKAWLKALGDSLDEALDDEAVMFRRRTK